MRVTVRVIVVQDEGHFKAVAARCIRRILVDHARARDAQKRGGGRERFALTTRLLGDSHTHVELTELDDLLDQLANEDKRAADVVELRFFGGMTTEQAADFLDISRATAERDWRFARAWLYARLFDESDGEGDSCSG